MISRDLQSYLACQPLPDGEPTQQALRIFKDGGSSLESLKPWDCTSWNHEVSVNGR